MKLLMLHGAIGSSAQLCPLAQVLGTKYSCHSFDFSGHGQKAASGIPYCVAAFASETIGYMDDHNIARADVFGYSMGGYVAMYLALHFPERIGKIITLATKFQWNESIAAKEILMLDAEKIAVKLPAFAKTLNERHTTTDWKDVLKATATMMTAMGTDNPLKLSDYSQIPHQTLVMLGDRDKMVTLEETVNIYRSLPDAQLCILPGTAHPIEQLNLQLFEAIAVPFLQAT
ncbi:MAG: alpha/beta fold hydrolase [Taibaiella sp.]|nr:alpha/beta fold hydrolase [Taibaiella sp.]